MTRKLLSVLLSMCILLTAILPVVNAEESEPVETTSAKNCHIMTQEWFGNKGGTISIGEGVGESLSKCLSNYFFMREDSYKEGAAVRGAISRMEGCSSEVQEQTQERAAAIDALEKRAGIEITDAKVTVRYGEDGFFHNEDGTITVYLYEYTFFDYDDLHDDMAATDLTGYGIYHKVTLENVDGSYRILTDEYDESNYLGICTMNQSTQDELLAMDYEPVELVNEAWDDLTEEMASADADPVKDGEMYAAYSPDKAAEYADKYVYHGATGGDVYKGYYNSAYYNYNPVGGDCANYTSQCILAGGMPQVVGTAFGTDGWYYKSGNDRSGTWTVAGHLRNWMASNRGVKVTAEHSTVWKGSPVFYGSSASSVAHATICVGKNSAGTPIINSHNMDVYHGVWNYWAPGTVYTTVQLAPESKNDNTEKHFGIDVSSDLGKIDWEKVKPNIEFATIHCGDGANLAANDDAQWARNASECTRLGIPFAARFFSKATTEEEAQDEAEHALRLLKDYPPTLPIYYELEDATIRETCSKEEILNHARIFCETLEKAGYRVGIFSNLYWWNNILTAEDYDQWDRWIAYWPSQVIVPPSYAKDYSIWQYTNKGSVSGISGDVRCNYWYGSLEASAPVDTKYPTPFKAYTLLWQNTDNGKIPVYAYVGADTPCAYICNGYNNWDDECTVEEVYTNGWCKVTVPGLSDFYYCKLSVFVNVEESYTPRKVIASKYIECYRRWNHDSPRGNIDVGDDVWIISETEKMFQVVYPTSTLKRCRWVDKSALPHTYSTKTVAPTCTAQGYDIYTCTVCGYSYLDAYVNATGHYYSYTNKGDTHEAVCGKCSYRHIEAHSYTDNICACGAVEILAPITDNNIVMNHSLNLASDISINYVVKASLLTDYDSFYMEMQVPVYSGNVLTGSKTLTIQPVLKESDYYFTMTDLAAINMNDMLLATLHMFKGGQEYVSKPDSYSVVTYVIGLLNTDGVAQERKVLCADLLRYGAVAQTYKGYRTDALATAAMTPAHKAYLSDLSTVTFGNTNTVYNDLAKPIITWVGKTLNLGSKVVVKFVFNAAAYTGDISKLTLRMVYQGSGGGYRTVILSNPTVYNAEYRMYAFEFDGLMAAELRTAISVAVYNGDTQLSQTMQYSADTYGNNQTGTLLELCKALFAYSDSAAAYFAK